MADEFFEVSDYSYWAYSVRTGIIVNCPNEKEAVLSVGNLHPTMDDIVFKAELVIMDENPIESLVKQIVDEGFIDSYDAVDLIRVLKKVDN